jgi:hypothetical protein
LEAVTHGENNRRASLLQRGECRRGHLIRGIEDVYVRSSGSFMCLACVRYRTRRKSSSHA